jgi:glycosyltransferase involved in cell wall biosynthesis
LRERFHPELATASIKAWNTGSIAFELVARIRKLSGWQRVVARNSWFQRKVVNHLASYRLSVLGSQVTLFAYSYAARDIFRFAKQQGWKTVLGQIDPGPMEEKIVTDEAARVPELAGKWQPAPQTYWNSWREECEMADRIVANSEWSRGLLTRGGIATEKLRVIPLAYEPPAKAERFNRTYPERFDGARPMRVLFLGQVNLRKGVARLFDAIRSFNDEPIEFHFVGPIQVSIPEDLKNSPRVCWHGPVSRNHVVAFYQTADVLIFPTLSDGFGLTQLEAQAWSLPIIASRFCGEAVRDGQNGLLFENLTGGTIADVLRQCLANPELLAQLAAGSGNFEGHSLEELGERLFELLTDGRQEPILKSSS